MTDAKVRFEDLKGLDDDEDDQKIVKKNKYTGLGGLDDDIHDGLDGGILDSHGGLEEDIGGISLGTNLNEKQSSDMLSLSDSLGLLVGKDKFADVKFVIGRDQKAVYAHRVFLAASSDIFEAMLFPVQFTDEKQEDNNTKQILSMKDEILTISINDVKPAAFKLMLLSIYANRCPITAEELPDLLICAKKFNCEPLYVHIRTFMSEGITVENACQLFSSAQTILNENEFGLEFIEENMAEIIASPSFETLTKERLSYLLKSDKLCVDELELFQACLRWATVQCKKSNVANTTENKKSALQDILPLIRFPLLNMQDLATIISPSGLLTTEQLLDCFTYGGVAQNKDSKNKPYTQFNPKSRGAVKGKWSFDPNFKSAALTVSNNNHTATNTTHGHTYVNGSTPFVHKGKHAWRVYRESGQTQWLLMGVCQQHGYSDNSYNQAGVWAMSGANQLYTNGVTGACESNFADGPIDCLYEPEENKLTIINLAINKRHEMILTGLTPDMAIVPHVGPHSAQSVSIYPIGVKEVGDINVRPKGREKK